MRERLAAVGPPLLIGVVHLPATPGAPRFAGSVEAVLEHAKADARALVEGGADALIVENFGDAPFFAERVPAETIASLALALAAVCAEAPGVPVGVNVLRNDARAALGLCAATGASFLRVNVFAGAMLTDQGLVTGCAAELLRERARLAPSVAILADVHVKHAVPLAPMDLVESATDAYERGGADALVLTGTRTGAPTDLTELDRVREHVPGAPLLVGSGVTAANATALRDRIRGAIVGTSLKRDGRVENPVERERVAALRRALVGA